MKLVNMRFYPSSVNSPLFGPNDHLSILFSNTLMLIPNCEKNTSRNIEKNVYIFKSQGNKRGSESNASIRHVYPNLVISFTQFTAFFSAPSI